MTEAEQRLAAHVRKLNAGVGPCPKCGSTRVAPYIAGEPSLEMTEAARRGELVIRGCMPLMTGDPTHRCECGHDFGSFEGEDDGT